MLQFAGAGRRFPGFVMPIGNVEVLMTQADALERLRSAEAKSVGTNQTAKAISRGRAQVVYIAKDADRRVVDGVAAAAKDANLEIVEVESMREIGRACGIGVGAAVAAILKANNGVIASEAKQSHADKA